MATKSNILYNGYGIINLDADGVTDNTTTIDATLNFWGMSDASGTVNTGPAVSPARGPGLPGNPVNGAADVTYGSNSRSTSAVPQRPQDGARNHCQS